MDEKYDGWKCIELNKERYYFNKETKSFAKEMDSYYLVDVKDPEIISKLEKIVGIEKVAAKKLEIIAIRN